MRGTKKFSGLVLDEEVLSTPRGPMPLADVTRAEFVREVEGIEHSEGTTEMSAPAVVGGAATGAVVFGPVGAVAGGLLGSTVKDEVPATPKVNTRSVTIVFETKALTYSEVVERDHELEASRFVDAVRKAVARAR